MSLAVSIALALWLMTRRTGEYPFALRIFRYLALYQDYYVIFPFIVILLAALLLAPVRQLGVLLAAWCGRHAGWVAAMTTVLLALGTHAVYHALPLSMDEYVILFQSRIFSEGKLAGQFPPQLVDWLIPEAIQGKFLVVSRETGAVASAYWPGFSLLLAPFTVLGVPWLLNPLLGGATVLVMHRLGRKLFGSDDSAGLVVLLTLGSQAVIINAVSYYTMPAHLLANAIFMLLLLTPSPGRAMLAGAVGSLALVLHYPVPHLLFALPWLVWLATQPGRLRLLGALFLGYLPLAMLLGWGWAIFLASMESGKALSELATPANAAQLFLGRLAAASGWAYGAVIEARVLEFAKLWFWAAPGLLAAAILGAWRLHRCGGPWKAIIGSGLLTYLGYFLMPFDQGHGWGYRYFHSAWAILPLLAVGALRALPEPATPPRREASGSSLGACLAACAILSLAALTPLRSLQVEHFIARHLAQAPAVHRHGPHVVIVNPLYGYYSWDLAQNDPFLRGHVIKLVSLGSKRDAEMMAALFPEYALLESNQRGSVWGVTRR